MIERRLSPRVPAPYPARLKGTDFEGQNFREETLLDNLSSRGSYLQLNHRLPEGAVVSLAMRLSTAPAAEKSALMAAKGLVRRVESRKDGRYGIAVQFIRRRVL
jgi:PilZ domain